MGGKVIVRAEADEEADVQYAPPARATDAAPERVEVDTLIERSDLGAGMHTQVKAGDTVPVSLEHFPRSTVVGGGRRLGSKTSRSSTPAKRAARKR